MRRSLSSFATSAALFIAVALTLIDIKTSSADESLVVRHQRVATAVGGHWRHRWRRAPVFAAPFGVVVRSERLTTALANQRGYNFDPYLGYYGGPDYYGGPYYYRPYFDGASPTYFATHPIVEW
jgi:hypothetical protein